jgi:hypothetical protein
MRVFGDSPSEDGSHGHHGADSVGAAHRGRFWCWWGDEREGAGALPYGGGFLRQGANPIAVGDGSHGDHDAGFVGAAHRGRPWSLWGDEREGAGALPYGGGFLRQGAKPFAVGDGSHGHHGADFVGAAPRGCPWCLWGRLRQFD